MVKEAVTMAGSQMMAAVILLVIFNQSDAVLRGGWNLTAEYDDLDTYMTAASCYCVYYVFGSNIHDTSSFVCIDMGRLLMVCPPDSNTCSAPFVPDPDDPEAVRKICEAEHYLGLDDKCEKWRSCTADARSCAARMTPSKDIQGRCSALWDGWSCLGDVEEGTSWKGECPQYLFSQYDTNDRQIWRECTKGGRWSPTTNYSSCYHAITETYATAQLSIYLIYGCQALSQLSLLAGVTLFSSFRVLRSQQRIRVHLHLFLCLFIFGWGQLLWTSVVNQAQIRSFREGESVGDSVYIENPIYCRFLNTLKNFALCLVFTAWTCESAYLHWLMVRTFQQPKLSHFITVTWAAPALVATIYISLRWGLNEKLCWTGMDVYWVISSYNLCCFTVSLCLLLNILRILWKQLQKSRNEPAFYRRAIKALLILMPPFGIFAGATMAYPPHNQQNERYIFDCFHAVVLNLQGFLISVVLCFCNGEVAACVKKSLQLVAPVQSVTRGRYRRRWSTTVSHDDTKTTDTGELQLISSSSPPQSPSEPLTNGELPISQSLNSKEFLLSSNPLNNELAPSSCLNSREFPVSNDSDMAQNNNNTTKVLH